MVRNDDKQLDSDGTTTRPSRSPQSSIQDSSTHPRKKRPRAPKPQLAGAARVPRSDKSQKRVSDPDKKQAARGATFIGLVFAAYVAFLFFSGQISDFIAAFRTVDLTWIIIALICMGLYFMLGTLAYVTAVYLDHDSPVGFRDLMSVEASGNFFGNLTPMQVGALPSQIYQLTKAGLSVGAASATQFTRFIVFQLGVVVFAAIMLWSKLGFFIDAYGDIVLLNLIVFAGHALELIGLFIVCLCPNFVRRVGGALLNWVCKHGWVKNRAKWDEMLNVQVGQFSAAFKRSAANIPDMALTFLITMFQLASLYSIPWLVLRAFGINMDYLTCLAAGSMVQLVSSAVPLPGGTGGAEGGFVLFFGKMFGSYATAGFLVWRAITFFLPTFAAVPMISLKSSQRESIYHRIQRWSHVLHHDSQKRTRTPHEISYRISHKNAAPQKTTTHPHASSTSSASSARPTKSKTASQHPTQDKKSHS